MEPRIAPTTTPVLGELEESERARTACPVWVGAGTAVVRNVVGADPALQRVIGNCPHLVDWDALTRM